MKKLLFTVTILFGIILSGYGQKISSLPAGSSLASGDLFVIVQSGTTKKLQYVYLGNVINDSSDVLRAEFPPLWRADIADTADVLRVEIAAASTIDTAWARFNENVILKFITDSVGIGTTTPNTKLQVVGGIEATKLVLNNNASDENILIGNSAGVNLTGGAGQYNVFIGELAGEDVTTADNGVSIGYWAGKDITTSDGGIFIGYKAGSAATDGTNICIGSLSGLGLTGSYNTLMGNGAGFSLTGDDYNSIFGQETGTNATGNNYTLVGYLAGENITGSAATLIGSGAGEAATSSAGLTVVGYDAATTLTESDYHTVMGYQALDAAQASDGSTVMGYQAAGAATGADGLTAIGYQAGTALTTGDQNTLIGFEAGENLTSGSANVVMGYEAGAALTESDYHTVVGYQALDALQTEDGSTVMGYQAGSAATAAVGFSAFGYQAGVLVTTGEYNSLFGFEAGEDLTEGAYNTGLGYRSIEKVTTGNYNTGVGASSLYNATSGNYNTGVGYFTGGTAGNNSGCVYLGYQAGYNNSTDNTLHIDNSNDATPLIWGDFSTDSLVVNDKLTVVTQALVDPSVTGTATDPSLAFGDGNTGWYEVGDNNFALSLGGTAEWSFQSTLMGAYRTTGPAFRDLTPTATVPSFIPNKGDLDTGVGHKAADTLSLVAGGVEGLRISEAAGVITVLATDTLRTTDYAGGPSGWATESDRRVKQNIESITDGLDIVLGLEGVRYERKDKPGVTKVGFIAQDVEKVLPEVVNPGNLYTMENASITAVLVEAIKEQQKIIEFQQEQLDAIIDELVSLKQSTISYNDIIQGATYPEETGKISVWTGNEYIVYDIPQPNYKLF